MAIGNFTHTWKVTKIQKFGSKTVRDSKGNTFTSYTDFVCAVWATLKTTNDHQDHSNPEHYIEKHFNWQWKNSPIERMDPTDYKPYAELTEQDYVNILKANGMEGVEQKVEEIFESQFVEEPMDTIDDPFNHGTDESPPSYGS